MSNTTSIRGLILAASFIALAGCTVHPPGERDQRDAASQAGKPYAEPIDTRQAPQFPKNPTPDQLVEYALLTNADLEQRYWEWQSAIEQIPQDGTQPATLSFSAGTALTRGHASWSSTTVGLSNDPMSDIKWPSKLDASAKQTLENARAAGRRFFKAKYELRDKVLAAYYDYALNAQLIRLEEGNQQLLKTTVAITEARSRAGSSGLEDVLKAQNDLDMSGNEIANMESQLAGRRATVNALLNRPADAPLPTPTDLPAPRPIAYTDTQLVALAAKQNPELLALADEIQGRQQGIRLAKLQYIPDFNLSAGTDLAGITQTVLGQATIPIFRYEALNAAIAQAKANLHASEAARRQAGNDLAAQVVADIAAIRDADRQLDLFEHTILRRAQEMVNVGRSTYETGRGSLADLLDEQRTLIEIERLVINLKISREKDLVDLESITASDLSNAPHDNAPASGNQP
jgi:outer membrane protein, heavy metal efflux system